MSLSPGELSFTGASTNLGIRMMRAFYLQPGIKYPDQPPNYPIPEPGNVQADASEEMHPESQSTMQYRANIAVLSKFWCIVSDVLRTYSKYSHARIRDHVSVQFAEFKFRELMAWADALPSRLTGLDQHSPIAITTQYDLSISLLTLHRRCIANSGPDFGSMEPSSPCFVRS